MSLKIRPIAIYCAVLCFFAVSLIGWIAGLKPFVLCKRAMTAALIGYFATLFVTGIFNLILADETLTEQNIKQKNQDNDDNN